MMPKAPTKLPAWLQQAPQPIAMGKQRPFLARNRRRLQKLLAQFAQPAPVQTSSRWQLSPAIKLVRLLLLLLLIALIQNGLLLWGLALLLGGQLLSLSPRQLRRFTRDWAVSLLIALLVVLPSYWLTGPTTVLFFGIKTALLLANAHYYRLTTPFQDLLTGLKSLHCPDVLIMTLAIAITYLRMLGNYLLHTMEALDLRTVAPTKHPYHLIGALFGNLYLKSYAYALELYAAMEARGFNGHYAQVPTKKHHWQDYLSLSPELILMAVLLLGRL
ncbi:cobalt ABC transporter permease [Lactobacillus sp. CBA3606]|uniref:energy-coupling factor transporter transmembrane component T n=1 Tax=Lactobacillus sp. CBA3606 TaxID=2099789 RepID=UPI000CFC4752|nr:energy-coupling factor transporter transmembrane component T [Lactobacillus sp. CBA3606]AVK64137.1 cobalt ABC transporter permease [Lactobacillus sp. CBA3606]